MERTALGKCPVVPLRGRQDKARDNHRFSRERSFRIRESDTRSRTAISKNLERPMPETDDEQRKPS